MKLKDFLRKSNRFFVDGWIILAFTLLLLFFFVMLVAFRQDLVTLQAYATFGTGLATVALALVTFLMVRATKGMVEEMRQERKQAYVTEVVALVICPLIKRVGEAGANLHKDRRRWWHKWPRDRVDTVLEEQNLGLFQIFGSYSTSYFIPYSDIQIEEPLRRSDDGFAFSRLSEFESQYQQLIQKIASYDKEAGEFQRFVVECVLAIHGWLTVVPAYQTCQATLRPYVVNLVFAKLVLPRDLFDDWAKGAAGWQPSWAQAIELWTQSSSTIELVVATHVSALTSDLNGRCNKLQKLLNEITDNLQSERSQRCSEFFISETAIREVEQKDSQRGRSGW